MMLDAVCEARMYARALLMQGAYKSVEKGCKPQVW
jgi:hypothetical protein